MQPDRAEHLFRGRLRPFDVISRPKTASSTDGEWDSDMFDAHDLTFDETKQRSNARRPSREKAVLANAKRAVLILEREAGTRRLAIVPRVGRPNPPSHGRSLFRPEGDYWTIAHQDEVRLLKDGRGLRHIALLLSRPGEELHALDLMAPHGATENVLLEQDTGPRLDPQAKLAYRRRLADLRDEREEAERFNDFGRASRARQEIELLTDHLAAGLGLGGRDRLAGSTAERARSAVTHAIRTALRRIRDGMPVLWDQLAPRIKTGTYCVYQPDVVHPIRWEL
jgi:hypothetical protein